jgi:hypothetical protein
LPLKHTGTDDVGFRTILQNNRYAEVITGWEFTFIFERHDGCGDRTGQILARVITPHEAVIMAKQAKKKSSVINGKLDMINQCTRGEDTGAFSAGER